LPRNFVLAADAVAGAVRRKYLLRVEEQRETALGFVANMICESSVAIVAIVAVVLVLELPVDVLVKIEPVEREQARAWAEEQKSV